MIETAFTALGLVAAGTGAVIITVLGIQFATNASRNISLANDNATKGLKD